VTPEESLVQIARRYGERCAHTTRLRKLLWRCKCWHYEPADYTPGAGYPGTLSCTDKVHLWASAGVESYKYPTEPLLCSRCARRECLYQILKSALAAERNARRGLLRRVAKLEASK